MEADWFKAGHCSILVQLHLTQFRGPRYFLLSPPNHVDFYFSYHVFIASLHLALSLCQDIEHLDCQIVLLAE
jgi:hypothetical protein